MTMNEQPKPCPICGVVPDAPEADSTGSTGYVGCHNYDCWMPSYMATVEQWNTRAEPDRIAYLEDEIIRLEKENAELRNKVCWMYSVLSVPPEQCNTPIPWAEGERERVMEAVAKLLVDRKGLIEEITDLNIENAELRTENDAVRGRSEVHR